MCAVLQRAWPWACLRPQRRSTLPWPQSVLLSHVAPDLLTCFLTQEIELTPMSGALGSKSPHTQLRVNPVQTNQSSLPQQHFYF